MNKKTRLILALILGIGLSFGKKQFYNWLIFNLSALYRDLTGK